ncbi:MAG: M56 family metallopeptidase [Actinobacteria bacterium]|nr:M56 family metallopeptidase [Actinomycetota bacterium]
MVSLVIVLMFLFVFRIKDSNMRILFFFVPLIKPFFVIAEKVDLDPANFPNREIITGIRFPDPNSMINLGSSRAPFYEVISTDMNYLYLLVTVSVVLLILLVRWIILAMFYRHLAYEEKVSHHDVPDIYNIIYDYTSRIKTKIPDVSLTHRNIRSPFIVGILRCTMVISPRLIECLSIEEKETVIHHELSHIKRNDNLTGWFALILRDLLFFNPFAYMAFFLIKNEQEKDCDKLMLRYSGKSAKEIARNILNAILKIKSTAAKTGQYPDPGGIANNFTGSAPLYFFNFKILRNRINLILSTDPSRIYSRPFPRIIMVMFFIILLVLQVVMVIRFDNLIIFLR